jgi:hypothetical protein
VTRSCGMKEGRGVGVGFEVKEGFSGVDVI